MYNVVTVSFKGCTLKEIFKKPLAYQFLKLFLQVPLSLKLKSFVVYLLFVFFLRNFLKISVTRTFSI